MSLLSEYLPTKSLIHTLQKPHPLFVKVWKASFAVKQDLLHGSPQERMVSLYTKLSNYHYTSINAYIFHKNSNSFAKKRFLSYGYLHNHMIRAFETQRILLNSRKEHLLVLNPLNLLDRGYTTVYSKETKLVTRASELKEDEVIKIRFYDGTVVAKIIGGSHEN